MELALAFFVMMFIGIMFDFDPFSIFMLFALAWSVGVFDGLDNEEGTVNISEKIQNVTPKEKEKVSENTRLFEAIK